MIADNRQTKNWGPFAGRLKMPEEAPEPLRSTLLKVLHAQETLQLLIFSPADTAMAKESRATVLAITDHGWIAVSENDGQSPTISHCDFANTVLVEMTIILLYGLLRIDFATAGPIQSQTILFNTVTRGLFHEATALLLNGMDGVTTVTPIQMKEMHPVVDALPLKFCNALLEFTPMGQRPLAAVHWPSILGQKRLWFRFELAPQAVLAVTNRELLLISEEKAWRRTWPGQIPKYGNIVTHCPFTRVEALQVSEHGDLDTVDVVLRVPRGSEKLKIPFPPNRREEVQNLVHLASVHAGRISEPDACIHLPTDRNGQ